MNFRHLAQQISAGILLTSYLACATAQPAAQHASATVKPGVVLLPIQGNDLPDVDRDQYRSALANALSEKYKVFSGAEIDKKLQSYAKKTCDAEKCLVEITADYQASLVGRSIISKEKEGYTVTVEVIDIYSDNRSELSDTRACQRCDKAGVIDLLKEIASGRSAKTAATDEALERSAWAIAKPQDTLEGYGAFLASFPNGHFADLASSGFDKHAKKLTEEEKKKLLTRWLDQSREQFVNKQYAEVFRLSRTILLLEPGEEAALLNSATSAYLLRRYDEVETAATKLTKSKKSQGAGYNLLGALREREGAREQALTHFKKGCSLKHEVACRNEKRLTSTTSVGKS